MTCREPLAIVLLAFGCDLSLVVLVMPLLFNRVRYEFQKKLSTLLYRTRKGSGTNVKFL